MDHKSSLSTWSLDFAQSVANSVWKIAPFRAGNRMWISLLLKAYGACLVFCGVAACILNSVEGEYWIKHNLRGWGPTAKGQTALDECIWFVFTTLHGIAFGEFNARGAPSRLVAMACITLGYWFVIFLFCIILLSNLPGEQAPSFSGVVKRMVIAVWPSYLVFLFFTITIGATLGPYVSSDKYGYNGWPTGVYFMWTVMHRMPFGDIWPNTPYGRTMVTVGAMMGLLYMPYALALVAVRCPTIEQHESLLGHLRHHPENALGRGYVAPKGANLQEVVMEEYAPEGNTC